MMLNIPGSVSPTAWKTWQTFQNHKFRQRSKMSN